MFKNLSKIYKLKIESGKLKVDSEEWKVKFSSHCEDERREDAAIQIKSAGSPRAKASRLTKKVIHFNPKSSYTLKTAFTLAEVLITLVIIGVVAAITVPILFNNTNDKEYNVARQKAKATIGEAFKLMTINGEIDKDKSTKEFVEEVLPKYLKVAKLCGSSDTAKNLTDCGFSSKVKRPDGTEIDFATYAKTWQSLGNPRVWAANPTSPNTWAERTDYDSSTPKDHNTGYALQTNDGFSLAIFYNPLCVSTTEEKSPKYDDDGKVQMSMDVICFNAIYDMNGSKGPNSIGKDIGFVGSFYNNYIVKAESVLPHSEEKELSSTDKNQEAQDFCSSLDAERNWVLPDVDELSLLHINLNLVRDGSTEKWFWSRSPLGGTPYFKRVYFGTAHGGARYWDIRTDTNTIYVRCVRNNTLR